MAIYGPKSALDPGILIETYFQETMSFYRCVNEEIILYISEGAAGTILGKIQKAWEAIKKFVTDKAKWIKDKVLGMIENRRKKRIANQPKKVNSEDEDEYEIVDKTITFSAPALSDEFGNQWKALPDKFPFASDFYREMINKPEYKKTDADEIEESKDDILDMIEECREKVDKEVENMNLYTDFFNPSNFSSYTRQIDYSIQTEGNSVKFKQNLWDTYDEMSKILSDFDVPINGFSRLINACSKSIVEYYNVIKDYQIYVDDKRKEYEKLSSDGVAKAAKLISYKSSELFAYAGFKDFEFAQKTVKNVSKLLGNFLSMYSFIDDIILTRLITLTAVSSAELSEKNIDSVKFPEFQMKEG